MINLPKTIEYKDNEVRIIDQTLLPERLKIIKIKDCEMMGKCIKEMKIRGAPAIGAAGALGMVLASLNDKKDVNEYLRNLKKCAEYLKSTRPTGIHLSLIIDKILGLIENENDIEKIREKILETAKKILDEDEKINKEIGKIGSELIRNGFRIMTHCNAGSLATVYYGTALAPIYYSWENGKSITVIVNETRPRFQGANLTAWELSRTGIPYILITDNAAAFYMKKNKVDLIIIGADRIAMNGDAVNKIGSYSLALAAKEHNVPFYVAAPVSTIDKNAKKGDDIVIEERDPNEILIINKKRIAPKGTKVWNPAFDVVPSKYIKGIITEKGIIKPQEEEIRKILLNGNIYGCKI